ncbi:predicted protein [Nematostella vectensis]|uniref:G-protein coupled receptors family 1 profile domain-containing protein n=1 Tax=Nematostella vectensis TaxID=45351 RepID=A7RJW0_NEMVE|nr:neuropeptide receptor 22 [Nematostella vectensis]XP_032221476.1 neuropeptide receptor 22 [Nematostella vectensis]EDO48343.1 predicted protein [Nematostella vectensis]|eukprot:XP_001640406.1 predicted protein [Nematostella vectensis]
MALSAEAETVFKVTFAALILLNVGGNSLVCLVVRRFQRMRTPMNYLLVNLAISDIVVGIFFLPRHLLLGVFTYPDDGLAADWLCKLITYANLAWLASFASVYTLVIIAWERYNAIMKPLSVSARFTTKKIKICVAFTWIIAFLVTLAEVIATEYNKETAFCDYNWKEAWNKADAAFWLFGVGVLPTVIMCSLYGRVIKSLWCSRQAVTPHDVSYRSLLKSRKRVTKAALTVTSILFACWMPNLIYYFMTTFTPKSSSTGSALTNVSPIWYRLSHVLILLNSSVNPLVYAVQDRRFRAGMKSYLCRCKRRAQENSMQQDDTIFRLSVINGR